MKPAAVVKLYQSARHLAGELGYALRDAVGISHAYHACAIRTEGGTVVEGPRTGLVTIRQHGYEVVYYLRGNVVRAEGFAAFVSMGCYAGDRTGPEPDAARWEVFVVEVRHA